MNTRKITEGVMWMGAIDWNRRLFDSLIPLPDGTSYNAYLVQGNEKTALLDTVDPAMEDLLMAQLQGVERLDYLVAHHAEQDHAGTIPVVLAKYPEAVLLCTPRGRDILIDHLDIDPERIRTVADGDSIDLGGKTLQFMHMPWVHWPETMVSWLPEDRILFSCDFFGSHVATSELMVGQDPFVCDAAKRYFAEIMMPFRKMIQGHLKKVRELQPALIAPSHGPIYARPECILSHYEEWAADQVGNRVVIPYVTMHGSTAAMVSRLTAKLADLGVTVEPFELGTTDIGKLAMALVDAATIVIATPTVHAGAHPSVAAAVQLANMLRPKAKFGAIIGSYGWGTKVVEQLSGMISNLKIEVLGTVLCKGLPRDETYAALDSLAETIAARHREL